MKNRGFTLVEIVLVLGLMALILLALTTLFINHNSIYNFQQGFIKTAGSGRTSLNEITLYTAQGYRVLASQTINSTSYTSGPTVLVLQLPSIDSSGLVINGSWDYVAFYTSGSQLLRQSQSAVGSARPTGARLLSQSVSAISFAYDNIDFSLVKKVSIDLQTQETVKDQVITNRLAQQVVLRNY